MCNGFSTRLFVILLSTLGVVTTLPDEALLVDVLARETQLLELGGAGRQRPRPLSPTRSRSAVLMYAFASSNAPIINEW